LSVVSVGGGGRVQWDWHGSGGERLLCR